MVDHLQAAEGLRDVPELEQLGHGQTISTRDVPKIPDGRTFMITTSSTPSRIRRVAPDTCSSSLFCQTNDGRYSVGINTITRQQPVTSVSTSSATISAK